MQITADVSKISKTFQRDLTFIFDVLSESLFGFVSYSVFQAVENVVSFTKKCFYRERGSPTMRNYAETFQQNHGYNMVQKLLTKYLSCRKQKSVTPLQSAITRKREVSQPHVLIFFLIFSSFSISSTVSRGKPFQRRSKKILISLYVKPGN